MKDYFFLEIRHGHYFVLKAFSELDLAMYFHYK